MTTIDARHATTAKRAKPTPFIKLEKPNTGKSSAKPASAQNASSNVALSDGRDAQRPTKHDRILTLLRQRDGTTVPEMMEATGWQKHSVRGFLAGTIKKKLGLPLVTSKAEGKLRRYRIETKRGR